MLTSVDVINSQGSTFSLVLEDDSNGYALTEIEGLDPVKAVLVSSSFANSDGEQYHSSRREARNLIFKISLDPSFVTTSVRQLRAALYEFWMPKSEVELQFHMSDGLWVKITGRVESFECPIFAKNPEATISLLCYDPDFVDLATIEVSDFTTPTTDEILIPYGGTVEAGVIFELSVNRSLDAFDIYHRVAGVPVRSLSLVFPDALETGDVLTINTIPGHKEVILNRDDVLSSVLYAVSPVSYWTELVPGDNYIRVYADGAGIPFTITYAHRHGGL